MDAPRRVCQLVPVDVAYLAAVEFLNSPALPTSVCWLELYGGGVQADMLLMLEDNAERLERFTAVLQGIDSTLTFQVWRDAHAMIREAGPLLLSAALISLDHDLEAEPGASDPGDGYLVTKWLVSQHVVRPVIIHSSNSERSSWMGGEFDLAGWHHWRVVPLGDDWIEADWQPVVRRLLNETH